MGRTKEVLPPVLVTAVRSGFDAFVQLQRIRFSKCLDVPFFAERDVAVPDVTAPYPTTLCEWSDLLLSRLKTVGASTVVDPTIELVWELVSTVLAILEGGGDSSVNASAPYLEWYRGRFVSVDAIHKARDALRLESSAVPLPIAGVLDEMLGPYMVAVQRCFLAGLFPHAAELVSALADFMRAQSSHAPFTADEESALADVVRLLAAPPETDSAHREWAAAANALVVDSKRLLEARDDAVEPIAQAAQQLKALCLDLLLMMSGDTVLIRQTCDLLQLDVADYIAAVCAISEPCLTLRELHNEYRSAWDTWRVAHGPWYGSVLERVLGCRCVEDIVMAMTHLVETLRREECATRKGNDEQDIVLTPNRNKSNSRYNFEGEGGKGGDEYKDDSAYLDYDRHGKDSFYDESLDTESDSAFGSEEDEYYRGDDDDEGDADDDGGVAVGLDADSSVDLTLVRRFACFFMAAHVADICAPPLGAPADQISLTFARNDLIADYMALFQHHPLLWRTAATYALCSPFMNPEILCGIISRRAVSASRDRHTFLSLHAFAHGAWDESGAVPSALLGLLRARYPASGAVRRWAAALAQCRRRALARLHDGIVRARLARGETAAAAWLAVECQRAAPVARRLERRLRAPGAMQCAEIRRVGDAVAHAFVAVDASANMRMLNVLRLCAALADFVRAAGGAEEDFLTAAERALQCAVPFPTHASTIFAIVEDAANVALSLPVARRPPQLIPLLANALEVALLNCSKEDAEKMALRAASIREVVMQLL